MRGASLPEEDTPSPVVPDADQQGVALSDEGDSEVGSADALSEALEGTPPHIQRQVRRVISMQSMAVSAHSQNPLLEKFNEEHLHKVIDYREAESQRNDRQAHSVRQFAFAFFIVALAATVGVLLFLVWQDEQDLAAQILAGLALFGSGFLGGLGLGRRGR